MCFFCTDSSDRLLIFQSKVPVAVDLLQRITLAGMSPTHSHQGSLRF